METAIYSTIYSNDINTIEEVLKRILLEGNFKKIEQGTILIYEDNKIELSIEPYSNSFYLSGRIKNNLLNSKLLINKIVNVLKDAEMQFSLDYQEENEAGVTTTPEYHISYMKKIN
ncbi:hypothetical protein [Apibacter sp. HY039]|uniref:hypothetical protein n=1 Tax=Apibacter sp. HY039 TaxID=2501476 RepID=UPI000FEC0FD1|nr:hypothetical protein [Apibacter sp. HY039]